MDRLCPRLVGGFAGNSHERPQGFIDRLRVREDGGNIRGENNDVAPFRVARCVFAALAQAEIVLVEQIPIATFVSHLPLSPFSHDASPRGRYSAGSYLPRRYTLPPSAVVGAIRRG